MKLTVFASGSTGNCSLIQGGGKSILLDAGISARRISQALCRSGLTVSSLDGIFITHEHTDHIRGLAVLLKGQSVPVYAPGAAAEHLCLSFPGVLPSVRVLTPMEPVTLGGMRLLPFPTPHDALQSVGYRIEAEGAVLFFATDTGCITDVMLRCISGADAALIEANHDIAMLRRGPYPLSLQRRILSDHGHLSNAECMRLAAFAAGRGTKTIILGHMSKENNTPSLALETVQQGLTGSDTRLYPAPELGQLEVEVTPCCV